jgi:hypothetical protein
MDERGSYMDPTRDLALLEDASLQAWFSRPIQIAEYTWDVDSALNESFNPWTLFWENARNIEKIKNFHLLRSKLHVKILLNGNAFYYGRALAAYEPLKPLDNTSPTRAFVQEDLVRLSQRMHVFLNPTISSGGSLELPFFWPKNNWVVGNNDWRNMGEIQLASFNNLHHANAGTDPINISVLAWAEDVKFAIPTRATPQPPAVFGIPEAGPPTSKKGEHDINVISRPATNVARVAGALSDIPGIGPYAKATQMGANAVANSAKLFGLSAPNDLSHSIFEPRAKQSLAVTDVKQSANKVTIDSKQELTIDPRTTGIQGDDELPIASIAGRESYLTTFDWSVTATSGTHLWNARVDPGLKARNGSEWHFPACALAALPFQYWRGSMRFRFQVVASEYHKGRLRISYDPRIGASNGEFNTQYTTIHDIAENKDFTVDVGWGQDVPFKESLGWYSTAEYGTSPLTISILQGNGVLSINVLNKLSAPALDNEDVKVNVFISMLDDFEVAAPDDKMSFLKFRPFVEPPEPPPRLGKYGIPESGDPNATDTDDDQDSPITDPEAVDNLGHTNIDTPGTTMVFMGEVIGSFRTLLKRAYRAELRPVYESGSSSMYLTSRGSFPTYGGFVDGISPASGSMLTGFFDTRLYNTTPTTLLNYLGRAFLGWRGSTRWTVDASAIHSAGTTGAGTTDMWTSLPLKLSRRNTFSNKDRVFSFDNTDVSNIIQNLNEMERGIDCYGQYLGTTSVNPVQTIEVPYLESDRFKFTGIDDNFESESKGPGWEASITYPGSSNERDVGFLTYYVSAGEDFNFFFFNGLPPVYYEERYSLDTASPD